MEFFMFTSAVFLALSTGQRVDAQEVANRYLRQLQNANAVSGVYNLSITGGTYGMGDVKFSLNREGQFRAMTSTSEEVFDGKFKYLRDLRRNTYQVFDSRSAGFPLLTCFEPMVQSKNIRREGDIFTGTGSPVATTFEGTDAVQMAFNNQRRYINPVTALPSGFTETVGGVQYVGIFKQVNLEPRLGQNPFNFTPRAGERQVPVVTDGLVAVGRTLPVTNLRGVSNSVLSVLMFVRPSGSASVDAMNGLADLAKRSRPKLNVLAVSTDNQNANQFFRGRRTPITTIQDEGLARAAGVTQYPTMVVVDRMGRVIHSEAAGMEGTLKSVLQNNGYTF